MAALSRKIEDYEPDSALDEEDVSEWRRGRRPLATNAWLIGEALSCPGDRIPGVQHSSGLLALSWFGYESEVVGVLGKCPMEWIRGNETLVVAMIHSMHATSYVSPYELEDEMAAFDDDTVIDEHVLLAREGRGELHPIESSRRREVASRLENRRLARNIWTLDADARAIITAAALKWLGGWSVGYSQRPWRPIDELDAPMQYAHAVASSHLGPYLKTEFFVEYVQRWLYEVVRPRPQTERGLRLWHDLVRDPDSRVADEARLHMDVRLAMGGLRGTVSTAACFDFYGTLNEVADHVLRWYGLDPHDGGDPWMHGFAGKTDLSVNPHTRRLVIRDEAPPDDSDIQF